MHTIERHEEFDFGSEEYARLFARSSATAFQHPIWMSAFSRHLVEARGAKWRVVTVRQNGRLVGLLPMTLRRKGGVRLLEAADAGVCDYCAPVLAPDTAAWLDWDAVRDVLGGYDILRIRNVRPEHEGVWTLLTDNHSRTTDYGAHRTELSGDFRTWRAAHVDRSTVSQTTRKWKRWMKQGDVSLERLADRASIERAIERLTDLRAGRFDGDPIQDPFVRAFYTDVAVRGRDGFAETWILRDGSDTAGVLFGTVHGGTFHYLLIGCDYDRYGRHSPGLQFYDRLLEESFAQGRSGFDFTIGDEPFKTNYGAVRAPMVEFHAGRTLPGKMVNEVLMRRTAPVDALREQA